MKYYLVKDLDLAREWAQVAEHRCHYIDDGSRQWLVLRVGDLFPETAEALEQQLLAALGSSIEFIEDPRTLDA